MHTVSLGIWVPVQVSLILTSVLTRTWPVSHCLSVRVSFSSPPTPLLPRFCLPRPRLLMSPSPGQQGFHGSVSACTLIRTELLAQLQRGNRRCGTHRQNRTHEDVQFSPHFHPRDFHFRWETRGWSLQFTPLRR